MSRKKLRPSSDQRPAKEQLKDIFNLHLSERRGMLVLMAVMVFLLAWVVYEQWLYEPPTLDLDPVEEQMNSWLAGKEVATATDPIVPVEILPFDPNLLEREDWRAFGLTEKQVEGIMRFQEKGGSFKVKKDVERMYTISPEIYARLEPFILLPDSIERKPRYKRETPREKIKYSRDATFEHREPAAWKERPVERQPVKPLNINSADTTELVTLPGIGPAFARGIVKYRESLGGYTSMEQLSEVFVLRDKPDAVERVKQVLFLDPVDVRKIEINTATAEEFAAHPYFSWKVANGLVNYRKQHGPFRQVEDIRKSVLVNDSLYQKIHPYLTVDP